MINLPDPGMHQDWKAWANFLLIVLGEYTTQLEARLAEIERRLDAGGL